MKKVILTLMAIASVGQLAMAFCGFYVAKAGVDLYNNKSEVIDTSIIEGIGNPGT